MRRARADLRLATLAALGAVLVSACAGNQASDASPAPTATSPSAAPTGPAPSPTAAPTAAPTTNSTPAPATGQLINRPLGTIPGAEMGYLEYLPAGYGDGEPRPLLLYNHGSSENGDGSDRRLNGLRTTAIPWVIDQGRWPADRPFIVLAPQHDQKASGTLCTTAAEIDEFLAFALGHYDVDPDRVYLTGVSCGAIGEWDYLGEHTNEVVAAAAPIAGDGHAAFEQAGCALGVVPIWAIHGGADTEVDPSGSVDPIEALQACTDPKAVDARVHVQIGAGHAFWDVVYDTVTFNFKAGNVYDWLLSHTRSGAPPS